MSSRTTMCKVHLLIREIASLEKDLAEHIVADRNMALLLLSAIEPLTKLEQYLDGYDQRKIMERYGRTENGK